MMFFITTRTMPAFEQPCPSGRFYTLGHSNRSLDELIDLLRRNHVEILADIRAFPHSRANPQFDIENLPGNLAACGIEYHYLPELGGRRHRGVPDSPNTAWRNRSFRNYADYMLTESFTNGLAKLVALAKRGQVAYFCSEALPWRCHRRLVSDFLVMLGHEVFDLIDHSSPRRHQLTPFALVEGSHLIYPGNPAHEQG